MATLNVLRRDGVEPSVTNMELFFDLVYVFAVTQLSHTLVEHLDARTAVEVLVLFAGVWWAWNYTAWATNYVDPDRLPVRVLLAVLMLLSLVMSASIPDAFGDRALAFAGAFVAMQLLRAGFMVWALRGSPMGRNYLQLGIWSAFASVFWIAGAIVDDSDARLALWAVAVLVDYGAPSIAYALPKLGRTPMSAWRLSPGHLAERCQLVVIIALGESLLINGQGFAEIDRTAATVAAFVLAFLGTVALWWLYFARHAEAALDRVARAADPARLGRGGYAYGHAVMVAGIIVVAVGDEVVLHHPTGHVDAAMTLTVIGGVVLYFAGMVLFTLATEGLDRQERIATVVAFAGLVVVAAIAHWLTPLLLVGLTNVVLFGLVGYAAFHARGSATGAEVETAAG